MTMLKALLLCAAGIAFESNTARAQVVNVWPGAAPGSELWTHKERLVENTPLGTILFDVVTPTLTA